MKPVLTSSTRRFSHRWSHMAVAMALGLAAAATLAANDPKAAKLYEDALQRFEKKDISGAIVQLKNALQIDRNLLPVHVLLGNALLASGESVPAQAAFEEALRLGVNRAEVVVPLARCLVNVGRHTTLVNDNRFSETGLPSTVKYSLLLVKAEAAHDQGDVRTSLKLIDEARAIDAVKSDAWQTEIPVRVRSRQVREAFAAAEKLLSLTPNSAHALYLRGTVSHTLGDPKDALAFYDKALKLMPTHVEARVNRAGLLLDLNRVDEAKADVSELRKSAADEPRGAYLDALLAEREGRAAASKSALGTVTGILDRVPLEQMKYRPHLLVLGGLSHFGLNEFEKAKPYLEAVARSQATTPVAKVLARVYLAEKNFDRAIETLDGYLRGNPGDSQAILLLASAHMAQGRSARATALMQGALKQSDRPEYRTALGISLLGSGRPGNALPELEAAFKRDPNQVQAGVALVMLYQAARQSQKAVAVAEKLASQNPEHPGMLNLLGTAKAWAGDRKAARQVLDKASKIDPAFSAPAIELARLDIADKAFDSALSRLNAVLARDERNVDALTEVARVALNLGRNDQAQKTLEKADDLAGPDNLAPGLRLVEFHLGNGKTDLAQEALKRLTSKAPEALPVLVVQARVMLAAGDAAAAKSSLSRASTLGSGEMGTLVQVAGLQLAAAHPQGAIHTLNKVLAELPQSMAAQSLMAQAEIQTGDLAKAEQRARQLVTMAPKSGTGHQLLGEIAWAKGQRAAAVESLRRAHQLDQDAGSMVRLLRAQGALGPAAAAAQGEQWLRTHPNDLSVRRTVGDLQAQAANFGQAQLHYELVIKAAPKDAEALNNLAQVLIMRNDPQALPVAERALALKPEAAHIIGSTGWAAFKAGQTDRALQLLRDARLRDPANPQTRVYLGSVLAKAGRAAEAREELSAALKQTSDFPGAKDARDLLRSLN